MHEYTTIPLPHPQLLTEAPEPRSYVKEPNGSWPKQLRQKSRCF
jgi:hypothetical protein